MSTVVDVLERRLRQLGVQRVHGRALGGLHHVAVEDPDLAVLLADADGRLGHHDGSGRLGAALLDGPILHLSSEPGGRSPLRTVGDLDELADALSDPPGMVVPGTSALHLALDLDAPADDASLEPEPRRAPVMTLDPALGDLELALVAGPGVVRSSSVEELRDFARTAGIGVTNTWGAKGVERWDSAFHVGTVGLQERDMALAGVAEADIVLTTGLDPVETPPESLGNLVVQELPPTQLRALTHGWTPSRSTPAPKALYETIARVVVPRYESEQVPLTAPRASLHVSGALPEGGVVVADPGPAGFWLARTLPTSFPGNVCVPATVVAGFAAAAGVVCALERRPCVVVSDQLPGSEGIDDTTTALLELAEREGLAVAVQLWGPRGHLDRVDQHVDLLAAGLRAEGVRIDDVAVRTDDTAELEAAVGPLVAWREV